MPLHGMELVLSAMELAGKIGIKRGGRGRVVIVDDP